MAAISYGDDIGDMRMEWQQKETIILNLIASIFERLLQEHPSLPIRAESS